MILAPARSLRGLLALFIGPVVTRQSGPDGRMGTHLPRRSQAQPMGGPADMTLDPRLSGPS